MCVGTCKTSTRSFWKLKGYNCIKVCDHINTYKLNSKAATEVFLGNSCSKHTFKGVELLKNNLRFIRKELTVS